MGDTKLYRIGELARATSLSQRTIDYYTKIGLIEEAQRTNTNYRLYHYETIERLERISQLKKEKYSLDEIKDYFTQLKRIASDSELIKRLTNLQVHMEQVERDAKELAPILDKMKPKQAKSLLQRIGPQSAAVVEVLVAIMDKQHHLL